MVRAGSRALSLFAHPLNARILRAHVDGPLRPGELDKAIGWAAPSSLRAAVGKILDLGVLARAERDAAALGAATELTAAGRELLPVASTLERWLRRAPGGPIVLDDPAAHGIVKVLTAGWDSAMVRGLAERPLTLTELSDAIPHLSYPALKRRLAKLRATHLVAVTGSGKSAAHAATEWLRRSVVPLAVGGRWELLHDTEAEPITGVEVEAAFLLTLPLVEIASRGSGACTLAVLVADGSADAEPEAVGVAVRVERGAIVSCGSGTVPAPPATWVLGTAEAWLHALIDDCSDGLRTGGARPRLAQSIVSGIHETLFRA